MKKRQGHCSARETRAEHFSIWTLCSKISHPDRFESAFQIIGGSNRRGQRGWKGLADEKVVIAIWDFPIRTDGSGRLLTVHLHGTIGKHCFFFRFLKQKEVRFASSSNYNWLTPQSNFLYCPSDPTALLSTPLSLPLYTWLAPLSQKVRTSNSNALPWSLSTPKINC